MVTVNINPVSHTHRLLQSLWIRCVFGARVLHFNTDLLTVQEACVPFFNFLHLLIPVNTQPLCESEPKFNFTPIMTDTCA